MLTASFVSPVSEPAAFEEDVAAGNGLYLAWLCTSVSQTEKNTNKNRNEVTEL